MTTGSFSRVPPAVSLNCGTAYPGEHRSKSWNGADQPPIAKEYRYGEYYRKGYWAAGPPGYGKIWIPPVRRAFKKRVWKPYVKRAYDEHPYSCTWLKRYESMINWQQWNPDWARWEVRRGTITSCYGGWNYGSSSYTWTANDDNALLGKLRNKVAGSSFNAGVFLAEAPQAVQMIFDAAHRIERAWHYARRGNFLQASRYLTNGRRNPIAAKRKVVANNWLELQYGWLPLLNDAYDAASFLAEQYNVEQRFVVRAKLQRAFKVTPQMGSPTNVAVDFAEGYRKKVIKAILKEKDIAKLSGLLDPLSVAWEKLPYSFVIDWFLPIGTWLQARGLASALTGTFVVSDKQVKFGGVPRYKGTASDIRLMTGFSRDKRDEGSLNRTVSTSLDVRFPETVPLDQVLGWRRAANAISLLTQRGKS